MRDAALLAIAFYQRYLSPYKGYHCAYRAYTGCASCSTLGARAIRRYGVWTGLALLRERFERCGVAYQRIQQRGFIDCGGCDAPCDLPSCDGAGSVCDGLSNCGSGGGCGGGGDKKKNRNGTIDYIPPARQRN